MLLRRPRLIGLRALAFRYLRLTPTLAFVLAAFAALVPHLGSGPWWYKMRAAAEGCDRWWWSTLLYVNNVAPVHYPQQCMPWTWYPNPNPTPDPDPDPDPDPNPNPNPTPTPTPTPDPDQARPTSWRRCCSLCCCSPCACTGRRARRRRRGPRSRSG